MSGKRLLLVVVFLAVVGGLVYWKSGWFGSDTPPPPPPTSDRVVPAAVRDGLAVYREGKFDEARAMLEKEIASDPNPQAAGVKFFALAECFAKGAVKNKLQSWQMYTASLSMPGLSTDQRTSAAKAALALGEELVYNPNITPDNEMISESYLIKTGDSVDKIAKAYKTTKGLVLRVNKITNPDKIKAGQIVRILKGSFKKILVDKSDFALALYYVDPDGKEYFFKNFHISTGQPVKETPARSFTIATKLENPAWPDPDNGGKYRAPDDPLNPLGSRWLGFGEEGFKDLGIHGTKDEMSIGKKVTNGCVRMRNFEVEEVYDLVPFGAVVTIQE